jgi:hypothetical protein
MGSCCAGSRTSCLSYAGWATHRGTRTKGNGIDDQYRSRSSVEIDGRFGGTCPVHLQDRGVIERKSQESRGLLYIIGDTGRKEGRIEERKKGRKEELLFWRRATLVRRFLQSCGYFRQQE